MMAAHTTTNLPNLSGILSGIVPSELLKDTHISALKIDSRNVKPGDLFIGLNGSQTSGREYINDAINNGASAVIVDGELFSNRLINQIPVYEIPDLKNVLGEIASRFFENPSSKLDITGVTGTNGKTSVTCYLGQALSLYQKKPVGIIGTLGYGTIGNLTEMQNTTPDVISVNSILEDFYLQNIHQVFMEVSSHGLDQGRVNNIEFDTAVFTNLSQDHLDYHHDMEHYGNAKRKLFYVPSLKNAVINTNDRFGIRIASEISNNQNLIRYKLTDENVSTDKNAEITGKIIHQDVNSIQMEIQSDWGKGELSVNLIGEYNASNILACLGVLCVNEIPFQSCLDVLSATKAVQGRMELFCSPESPKVFVDYSHSPDALDKSLSALRKLGCKKLVCVFGCGGDRDRSKRPVMGKIAEQLCDEIYLTNDNPRTEPAEKIIQDILSGMENKVPCVIEQNRSIAIETAIKSNDPDSFILVAGKGHETYQETGGIKVPFSDRQLVINILESCR